MILDGPLIDHHCHGLLTHDVDRAGFEALLNEGESPPSGTTYLDSLLGLAVRRHCAPVLGLAPHASPEDYLARRSDLGVAEVNRRLVAAAGIDTFCVDTGLTPGLITPPGELAGLVGGRGLEVVRLEALATDLLAAGSTPTTFGDDLRAALAAAYDGGAVGCKSVAAYRIGLALPGERPSDADLRAAVGALDSVERIADPVVNGWLAWAGVEAGRPVQFHVGYGDRDVDLHRCDPLLMTDFLRGTAGLGTPVMLLHTYPFHRHAAYLAQVFGHVHLDLGLATHNTGALSTRVLAEALELAPFGQLLFSTDAYGLAELYLLGALLFRRAFETVVGGLVTADELTVADAERIGRLVGRDNATRVYGL